MSNNKALALKGRDIVEEVTQKVMEYNESGEIDLPSNYSVGNALKFALLKLQETKDKSGKPALDVCTESSVGNALLETCLMGLNPAKDQVYYVVYGNKLVAQRSYFGSMTLVKQMAGAVDVDKQVIYAGDEFDYSIENGRAVINTHKQSFGNKQDGKITGAYAVIKFGDERPDSVELMTIKQLKTSWKQGKTFKEGKEGTTHEKFTEEMAKKTVVQRACKSYINSSSDDHLFALREAYNKPETTRLKEEIKEEQEELANSEVIDLPEEDKPTKPREVQKEEDAAATEPEEEEEDQEKKSSEENPIFEGKPDF